jgi:hypothetical protein
MVSCFSAHRAPVADPPSPPDRRSRNAPVLLPPPPLSPQAAEHEKPFKMALPINQSMQRPEFGRESEFHQPPGTMAARIVRGKVGPKYESWSGSVQTTNPALRNCECQTPPRGSSLPPLPPNPLSPKPPNPLLFGPAPAPAPAPAAGAPAPATYCRKVLPPGAGGLYPAFMAHRTMHPSRQPRCLESCALR